MPECLQDPAEIELRKRENEFICCRHRSKRANEFLKFRVSHGEIIPNYPAFRLHKSLFCALSSPAECLLPRPCEKLVRAGSPLPVNVDHSELLDIALSGQSKLANRIGTKMVSPHIHPDLVFQLERNRASRFAV